MDSLEQPWMIIVLFSYAEKSCLEIELYIKYSSIDSIDPMKFMMLCSLSLLEIKIKAQSGIIASFDIVSKPICHYRFPIKFLYLVSKLFFD